MKKEGKLRYKMEIRLFLPPDSRISSLLLPQSTVKIPNCLTSLIIKIIFKMLNNRQTSIYERWNHILCGFFVTFKKFPSSSIGAFPRSPFNICSDTTSKQSRLRGESTRKQKQPCDIRRCDNKSLVTDCVGVLSQLYI